MALRRPAAILLVSASLLAAAGRAGGAGDATGAAGAGGAGGANATGTSALSPTPPVPLPTSTATSMTPPQPAPTELPRTGDNDLLQALLGSALVGAGVVVRVGPRAARGRAR
jgi:LPXTG-motif cell wall-anchored protein